MNPKVKAHYIGLMARQAYNHMTRKKRLGKVHSVFSNAFNVIGPWGLITVLHGSVRHPAAITLEDFSGTFTGMIEPGWVLIKGQDEMQVLSPTEKVELSLSLRDAAIWDGGTSELSRFALRNEIRAMCRKGASSGWPADLSCMAEAYNQWGKGGFMGRYIPLVCASSGEVICRENTDYAATAISRLIEAIKCNHCENMEAAVLCLLGLGHGLTPSGDDMLGGLMATLVLVGQGTGFPSAPIEHLRRCIRENAPKRTTTLSSHLLRYACEGMVCDLFFALIVALALGRAEVKRRAKAALKWGGSSGEDTTLGICLGFRLCALFFRGGIDQL